MHILSIFPPCPSFVLQPDQTAPVILCLCISAGNSRVSSAAIDRPGPAAHSPERTEHLAAQNKKMSVLSSIDSAQSSGSITPHMTVILASELY